MHTSVQFGSSDRSFKLKSAILIYQDESGSAATTHDVAFYHGKPVIQAGRPITVSALESLMVSLGRKSGVSFIAEQVVSLGLDRVVWWCAAGRRRIWFRPDRQEKKYDNLRKLNGKFVHHPPLLFIAGGRGAASLRVYALAANQRPTPETHLWRAPYWNLDSDGGMCRGNIHLPTATPESIAAFEKAFFNSAFTHHNAGSLLTRHADGHDGLWKALSQRKSPPDEKFWSANLCETTNTLRSILK